VPLNELPFDEVTLCAGRRALRQFDILPGGFDVLPTARAAATRVRSILTVHVPGFVAVATEGMAPIPPDPGK